VRVEIRSHRLSPRRQVEFLDRAVREITRVIHDDTEVHPELINGRFAYVSVSRASHDAQIYTNSAATLAET
jgi:hypothetical protein